MDPAIMINSLTLNWVCIAVLSVLCCNTIAVLAQDDAPPADAKDMMLKMGLELDAKQREVRLAATVCLDRGILEYFICLAGRGQTFEHESAFSTACTPSVLHLALLAIGAEPCEYEGDLNWEKSWSKKPASRIRLRIEYVQDGKRVQREASELLTSRGNKEARLPEFWIFTGSYFGQRSGKPIYAADAYGGIAGFCQDDASVLQTGRSYGNPYSSEAGLEINHKNIPPRGTQVKLIFSPYTDEAPTPQKASK
jgi:hypothetical protein